MHEPSESESAAPSDGVVVTLDASLKSREPATQHADAAGPAAWSADCGSPASRAAGARKDASTPHGGGCHSPVLRFSLGSCWFRVAFHGGVGRLHLHLSSLPSPWRSTRSCSARVGHPIFLDPYADSRQGYDAAVRGSAHADAGHAAPDRCPGPLDGGCGGGACKPLLEHSRSLWSDGARLPPSCLWLCMLVRA